MWSSVSIQERREPWRGTTSRSSSLYSIFSRPALCQYLVRLSSEASTAQCKPAKRGSGGGMPAASPMLKSAKRIEKKEKEVPQLGLCTFPSLGSSCFILEFVFDFRKDNLVILMMRFLFPYQRPIFLDLWKDNLMILELKFLLIKDQFSLVNG